MKIRKKSLISKEYYSIKEIVELVNSGLKLGDKKDLNNFLEKGTTFHNCCNIELKNFDENFKFQALL